MASGIVIRHVEARWKAWLSREFSLANGEYISTLDWMESLLVDDLLPKLQEKGYILAINQTTFVGKLLNHTYRFERDYLKGETMSRLYDTTPHTDEDYDYFFNIKCPDTFWKRLARRNMIEWFADGDDFATRLWIELPFWVAQYIDFTESAATDDIEQYGIIGDEPDFHEQQRKGGVDPYVVDYYGWR
jgi:hypothetical protein